MSPVLKRSTILRASRVVQWIERRSRNRCAFDRGEREASVYLRRAADGDFIRGCRTSIS